VHTPPDAATATPDLSETTIDSLVDGRTAEHTPLFLAVAQVAAGGAACGALLAPALGFSLFRDIPLWRLYTYSAAGTVLGGLLAALVGMGPIIGAFGGLAAALSLLRLRARYRA
jgi:hypothetical protein